jgi:hypothetical protein
LFHRATTDLIAARACRIAASTAAACPLQRVLVVIKTTTEPKPRTMTMKKLSLKKETIRSLVSADLDASVGGVGGFIDPTSVGLQPTYPSACATCGGCEPEVKNPNTFSAGACTVF